MEKKEYKKPNILVYQIEVGQCVMQANSLELHNEEGDQTFQASRDNNSNGNGGSNNDLWGDE
jgi:hypothetical protein